MGSNKPPLSGTSDKRKIGLTTDNVHGAKDRRLHSLESVAERLKMYFSC